MKKILAVVAASLYLMSPTANAQTITGAGATFPFPIYSKWAEAYQVKTDVQLNYQSIGSSGGIKQIKAATRLDAFYVDDGYNTAQHCGELNQSACC